MCIYVCMYVGVCNYVCVCVSYVVKVGAVNVIA